MGEVSNKVGGGKGRKSGKGSLGGKVQQDKKGREEATLFNSPLFYQLMRREDRVD